MILNQWLDEVIPTVNNIEVLIVLIVGEFVVVILEFAMCCCLMDDVHKFGNKRLLLTLLFTNSASFFIGIIFIDIIILIE